MFQFFNTQLYNFFIKLIYKKIELVILNQPLIVKLYVIIADRLYVINSSSKKSFIS